MKILLSVALSLVLSAPAFAVWDLNDVSYLMPLPAKVGPDNLLGLEAPGKGGPLLPPKFLDTIPILTVTHTQDQIVETLRVLGMRIDPCFPLPTPQSCQRQLRLVWQPIEEGRFKAQTVDAALHSFYVLTDDEFVSLLKDLAAWKKKFNVNTTGMPLQVHPAWVGAGDSSPAFADFSVIIKKYAGQGNLTRVTAMVLRGAGDMWGFQGFEVRNGRLQFIKVPRTDKAAQAFVNRAVPADHFEQGMIAPEPVGEDTINKIIVNSSRLETGNEELIRKEVRAAYRIENPHVFNPENMDCVNCHVAQMTREWVTRKRSDIGINDLWQSFGYQNPRYNMSNVTPILGHTQNLRAFGYFIENVAISQRVINESAEVADTINQYFSSNK
ncbi:MAG: hypothetical protein J7501_03395 [Bdellovibrio sp.]|nr:hypothetical protein [Bdellovibrio sp.]